MKFRFFVLGFMAAIVCAGMVSAQTFTNAAPITINSSGAGSPYPSNIPVTGVAGSVTKVTVKLNSLTHTYPDDVGVLVVGPTGVRVRLMVDSGGPSSTGGGEVDNATITFDDAAANSLPDGLDANVIITGTYRPTTGTGGTFSQGAAHPANFVAPAPPAPYSTMLSSFNGLNANGTWSLYVDDDAAGDSGSISGGWAIIITTAVAGPQQHVVDYNGDGRTDFSVIRGIGTQMRWFNLLNGPGTTFAVDWGVFNLDTQTPGDFDGDLKTDIAVWRPDGPGVAAFYILQSMTLTVRIETFGQNGDIPTVIGDYDGDGKDDPAVYRDGAGPDQQSFWFFRGSLNNPAGNITFVPWGTAGDFEAPGDYDGDNKNDFVIQRDDGSGNAQFWKLLTMAGTSVEVFGFSDDSVVPGDYDGDGKTDLALARRTGGAIQWFFRPSNTPGTTVFAGPFGVTADSTVQGDYDGDGRTDIAVWRGDPNAEQNYFYVRNSSNGAVVVTEWGQCPTGPTCDIAVAEYNTH